MGSSARLRWAIKIEDEGTGNYCLASFLTFQLLTCREINKKLKSEQIKCKIAHGPQPYVCLIINFKLLSASIGKLIQTGNRDQGENNFNLFLAEGKKSHRMMTTVRFELTPFRTGWKAPQWVT